ncbi:MAG: hypothetical protein KGJ57_19870 [Sphingomonadales bacterium]|nr:hypothetical protein [Sphingomonadales bacterium]MDE2171653.1 hypothetical protein [Sphingomonadales bacterium]
MESVLPQTVGIDISKVTLDVFAYPAGGERRFSNTAKGHKELIDWLAQWQIERIAYEATGVYHRQLEQALTMIRTCHTCFCGELPAATIASSRAVSAAVTSI